MSNSFVQVPVDSTGKRIDTEELSVGGQLVHRQRIQMAGDDPTEIVAVKSGAAVAADFGIVTRSVPETSNITSTGYDATTASTEALAANANRRGLMIQNVSDTRIIARFGSAPVATPGVEVGFAIEPGGGSVSWSANVDTRALNVIHAGGGNKRLLISEW